MLARGLHKHVAASTSPALRSSLIQLRTTAQPRCSAPLTRCFTTTHSLPHRHLIFSGPHTTAKNDEYINPFSASSYYFQTGYSIFAKRPSRPFPPPFLSLPSHSFSDPLTTHQHVRARQPLVSGKLIRGLTNGDDAILISGQNLLIVNDGVGAWAQKERGHAALWSRLIGHFWGEEVEGIWKDDTKIEDMNMTACLQRAFSRTQEITKESHDILGTTTACSAFLHVNNAKKPVVLCTNLGDCAIFIIRPSSGEMLYKTTEQWHWFDCPRQLGTNSPDTPEGNAVTDAVAVEEGDVIVVVSDGCTDNLFEEEITAKVSAWAKEWEEGKVEASEGALYIAKQLMEAAKEVALDPNGESPYMERALDEGLAISEGGKLDDISVVVGICTKR